MGLMGRFTMIVKAKANKALDRAEDPRETLDYSYEKQLELLQKVRRGVADVATSKKRLELQVGEAGAERREARRPGAKALQQNREDLARVALERKKGVQLQLQDLDEQRAQLQTEQDKLVLAEQRLTAKVEAFRTRKETIKAQYTAAEAQTKIGEAFSGVSEEMADVGMAMERAEGKVETMRARAGAIDELLESGALTDVSDGRDSIDRELESSRCRRRLTPSSTACKRRDRRRRAARPARSAEGEHEVIVRILGEGQYRLDERGLRGGPARSTTASRRRPTPTTTRPSARRSASCSTWSPTAGAPLPADELHPSDAIVPGHGTTLQEARELLSAEGLIPG